MTSPVINFKFIYFYLLVPKNRDKNNVTVPLVSAEVYNDSTNSLTVLSNINANSFTVSTTNKNPAFYDSVSANGACHWLSTNLTYILCFEPIREAQHPNNSS
ncbi:hypothetical protein VNO78_27157 [Psophocarpus tetragonolobus]|uniref:Uncharacterized protein n=1 Tax=Psophocarpus tetragonolobus TaxID=3891 RepID=A0AAN9XA50_PSOTE